MNRRYLSLILFGVSLLPASVLYLSGCQAQTSIEQNSNSDSNLASDLGSEQVIPQPELSGMAAKIKAVAEPITVRIDASSGNGSGVIIAHQGQIYYVLTAEHVVTKEQSYKIVAPDGKQYSLDYSKVKKIAGSDLAVIQFTSQQNYPIATLGDYQTRREQMVEELSTENNTEQIRQKYEPIHQEFRNIVPWLFLFGWQRQQDAPQPKLTAGRDFTDRSNIFSEEALATTAFKDISTFTQEKGYQLSYTNFSQGGMSGGAVFDNQGRVVGIHTAAEGERVGLREIQLGLSLGVPIKTFLDSVAQAGIKPEWLKIETSLPPLITAADETAITEGLFEVKAPTANAKATDWINYGNELWRLFRYEEAIIAFDQAIALQPDLAQAHYGKGISLKFKEDFREMQNLEQPFSESELEPIELDRPTYKKALASFQKTTELDPNFDAAWREQAILLEQLGKKSAALAAYEQAISLNPNNDRLHSSRGSLLMTSFRPSEAIKAYDQAISIKPNAFYYLNRSTAALMKGDLQQAKADIQRAQKINPEFMSQESWSDLLENFTDLENSPDIENLLQNFTDLENSPELENLLQNYPDLEHIE